MSSSEPDPAVRTTASLSPPIYNQEGVPFWNTNVPPALHTAKCPHYLQYAFRDKKDREVLLTNDKDFRRQTWQDVRSIVRHNQLDAFRRVPTDLRRYREYCAKLVEEYGTVMAFVMKERIQWGDMKPRGRPFEHPDDIKILCNDWPYGVDERIRHLVVWTKFDLTADPMHPDGDLTPEARQQIDRFVKETFVRPCGADNVIWFKNWSALKSIQAVEHFHVMLFDPDPEFVREITKGDVPLAEKVRKHGECPG